MPYERPALRGEIDATFGDPLLEPMHLRLVDYGLCWLLGGATDGGIITREIVRVEPGDDDDPSKMRIVATSYRDRDMERKRRNWTRPEIDAAGRLHSRIIRLPLLAHALTIMVFYGESLTAANWAFIAPDEKAKILRDLTFWPSQPYGVNARLRRYSSETGQKVAPIRSDEFIPIMLRAMRMLVNGERMCG